MVTPKTIVCACEDVNDVELREAIDAGCTDLESLKRLTGFATGPCQGKACLTLARCLLAEATGQDTASMGAITFRAPTQPIPLRYLAGAPEEERA